MSPAVFAYLDPFSGTILLQVVIGAIVGVVAFFHRSIWRLRRLFSTKDRAVDDGNNSSQASLEQE